MIILGLNAFGKNPSACLVRDGTLTSFCQEERFTRLKGSHGFFPSHSVMWCLKSQKITLQDVDRIAFSWGCEKFPFKMIFHMGKVKLGMLGKSGYSYDSSIHEKSSSLLGWNHIYLYSPRVVKLKIRDCLRSFGHKGPVPRIEFVGHHLSHAYQAYYQSPFNDAIILVADGSGEENCISGYSVKEGIFRKVFGFDIPQSLGWYYGGFTAYLGFHPNRDEGKLMGLAAYGESRKADNPWLERLDKIIKVCGDGFRLDSRYFKFGGNEYHPRFTDQLVKYITSCDPELTPVGIHEYININGKPMPRYFQDSYIDLAYAVQNRLEEIMTVLVKRLIRETGIKNLCMAGGIAMNCKSNGAILCYSGIDDIFCHPASSDDGSCLGAAFYISKEFGEDPRNILHDVQYGPSFSNDCIKNALNTCDISSTGPDDICSKAAELLAKGKILGWFHRGVEMGARALGGRSIIACPRNKLLKETINSKVKFREFWRPYCPSIKSDSRDNYIENSMKSPFMIISGKARARLIKEAPATVHIDKTVRPQTVEKDILPKWYHLLDCVESNTGEPILLNTSFNIRGEPIVCNPYDAIRCFYSTGLDGLVLEDLLIIK